MSRMPACRWGEHCKVKDCPSVSGVFFFFKSPRPRRGRGRYRPEAEADKPQCVFYQQGFCIHGTQCRYRHFKQGPDKRPLIADFSLGIAQGRKFEDATAARRRPDAAALPRRY